MINNKCKVKSMEKNETERRKDEAEGGGGIAIKKVGGESGNEDGVFNFPMGHSINIMLCWSYCNNHTITC